MRSNWLRVECRCFRLLPMSYHISRWWCDLTSIHLWIVNVVEQSQNQYTRYVSKLLINYAEKWSSGFAWSWFWRGTSYTFVASDVYPICLGKVPGKHLLHKRHTGESALMMTIFLSEMTWIARSFRSFSVLSTFWFCPTSWRKFWKLMWEIHQVIT